MEEKDSNVIYIGHLPHGFYEKEIYGYFSQFGTVLKVRVARNKKSGMSKGYGFIKFKSIQVAKIASSTMNNYLMFDKILKCHIMPKSKIRKELFCGIKINKKQYYNIKEFSKLRLAKIAREENKIKRSEKAIIKINKRREEKKNKVVEKLKETGINFSYKSIINNE